MNYQKPENTGITPEATDLFGRIAALIEASRKTILRTVNSEMVTVFWHIGREIVQEQQSGHERALYGEKVIEKLSQQLIDRFGRGYSVANLKNFRQFYLTLPLRGTIRYLAGSESADGAGIRYTPCSESFSQKQHTTGAEFNTPVSGTDVIDNAGDIVTELRAAPFSPDLGWSHYRVLMRIENELIRSFYETETIKNRWNSRDLERQIATQLFERIAHNKNGADILKLATSGHDVETPADAIRDPLILEFLNLPESNRLVETDFEAALISHLQEFLLELGKGFAFIGRQLCITIEGKERFKCQGKNKYILGKMCGIHFQYI